MSKNIKIFYEEKVNSKFGGDYEFNRWFSNLRTSLDYIMTYKSISYHIKDINFNNCLEIGPGPGTWTRLLYKKNKSAKFDLIDISKEMKRQFFLEMRNQINVDYIIKDIDKEKIEKNNYDFVFSSRAIEYFEDKDSFIKKIFNSMRVNSQGIIITKNPLFGFKKKDKRWQHKGQIKKDNLVKKIKNMGFKNIKIYPVVFRMPILDRFNLKISKYFFDKFYKRTICKNKLFLKLVESYLIKFEK